MYVPCAVGLVEVDIGKARKVIQAGQCKRKYRLALTGDAKSGIGDIRFRCSDVALVHDLAAHCRIGSLRFDDEVSDTV